VPRGVTFINHCEIARLHFASNIATARFSSHIFLVRWFPRTPGTTRNQLEGEKLLVDEASTEQGYQLRIRVSTASAC
jgi:hypothetical protein